MTRDIVAAHERPFDVVGLGVNALDLIAVIDGFPQPDAKHMIDDQARRTATITADTDLTCYGLTSWEFRPLVETNAQIAWKLLQVMAKRLRESEQQQISI